MNKAMYDTLAPLYMGRRNHGINPVAVANPAWMEGWWARRDAFWARVDELMAQGKYDWATAYMQANPTVPITEESVLMHVPALVEVPDPTWDLVFGEMDF